MLTNQEVFDKIVAHARKQKCQCEIDGHCLYRDGNGNKCFAGVLIEDSEYNSNMEFRGVLKNEIFAEKVESLDFLSAMQGIHDGYFVEYWERQFQDMAEHYKLKYTPPDDIET